MTRGVSGYRHFCQVGSPCTSNFGRRRSRQSNRLGPSIGGASNGEVASSVRVRLRGFFKASSYVGCSSKGAGGSWSSKDRGCVPSSGAWSKNASASSTSSDGVASSAAAAASECKDAAREGVCVVAWCGGRCGYVAMTSYSGGVATAGASERDESLVWMTRRRAGS